MKAVVLAAALRTVAAAPPAPCLNDREAEALTQVALPEIIRQAGVTCAPRLPAANVLRRRDGPLLARYDAAAERAWPAARAALVKLSAPEAEGLLQSQYVRPLLLTLAVPLVIGRLDVADCPVLGRLADQLAPLPPANAAAVVVTAVRYLRAQRAGGELARLPLCAEAR
jgi:hypothetical protein